MKIIRLKLLPGGGVRSLRSQSLWVNECDAGRGGREEGEEVGKWMMRNDNEGKCMVERVGKGRL